VYLPSYRIKGFPTPANFESLLSVRSLVFFDEERSLQILVNIPATDVTWCIRNNAKPLGLMHLHLPEMGSNGGLSDGARLIHHWTHELLIQQTSVSDGENTPRF
jgi:hypothetical protein